MLGKGFVIHSVKNLRTQTNFEMLVERMKHRYPVTKIEISVIFFLLVSFHELRLNVPGPDCDGDLLQSLESLRFSASAEILSFR